MAAEADAAVVVAAAAVAAAADVEDVSEEVINCKRVSISSLKCSEYFLFACVSPFGPSPSGLSSSEAFSLLFRLFLLPVVVVVLLLLLLLLLGILLLRIKLLNLALFDEVTIGVGAGTAVAADVEVLDDNKGDDSFTLLLLLSKLYWLLLVLVESVPPGLY